MEKILTIIIPTYNMEKYLRKCLDSLIIDEEGMQMLEVLVINDGSKDSSSRIGHEYQDKYPETFKVIDKENGNYGSCINCGLKEAKGRYVKVLDADDTYDNQGFTCFMKLLQDIDVDLFVTDYVIVDESGCVKGKSERKLKSNCIMNIADALDEFLHPMIQMHAVTYKTQNLRDIGYYQTEGISYTDQEWMFMPMSTVNTLYYFPVVVYRYLVGRVGQTVGKDAHIRNISHHIKSDLVMLNHFSTIRTTDKIYKYLKNRCVSCFQILYFRYLIMRPKILKMEDLIYIEHEVRLNPVIYLETSKSKFKNVPYIQLWRQSGASACVPFMIRILSILYKLKNGIRRML